MLRIFQEAERDLVLWDVVEEHLDEAAFACRLFSGAFDSPVLTLSDLREHDEKQLRAHLAGLLAPGPSAVTRLLQGELAAPPEPDPDRLLAVAFALLAHGRDDLVTLALGSAVAEISSAAQRACELAAGPAFDAWVLRQLDSPRPEVPRKRLLRVAASRNLVLENVLEALQSDDADEAAAAAACARLAPAQRHLFALEWALDHPAAQVRDAALVSALAHGSAQAFQRCRERASDPQQVSQLAMLLVALLGGPVDHQVLQHNLTLETHRHAAAFALGYCGQAAVADTLIEALASPDVRLAKLVGEALCTLLGLDPGQGGYRSARSESEPSSLPPLEEEDLDASLEPVPDADLPLLGKAAVGDWYRARQPDLAVTQRLLEGAPWTIDQAVRFLERAPLRRRHPIGLWLSIRSGGALRIDTRATSVVQDAQLASLVASRDEKLKVRFSRW
ncbi:MAG: hypothetical protein RLZZ450_3750 [Pseudomonadota bacterium]|jgi:uncharacterized protein (TIGR02270 family)